MASKNKEARKSIVATVAELQETRAIWTELYCLKYNVEADLHRISAAQASLQHTGQALSRIASRLRDLLQAQEHRSPPRQRQGSKPAKRSNVDGALQTLSQLRASKRRVESRKGLSRKPSGKEFFHGQQLPH